MPIALKKAWGKGWKHNDASDPIFCVHFIDKKSGKLLFIYAPCYEDMIFWRDVFKELIHHEYKKLQKALANTMDRGKRGFSSSKKLLDRETRGLCSNSFARTDDLCNSSTC